MVTLITTGLPNNAEAKNATNPFFAEELNTNGISEIDLQAAELIQQHLIFNQTTYTFTLQNEEQLASSLQNISSNVSLNDIKTDLINVNQAISNSESNLNQRASGCSIALGLLGLFHGINMQAAMLILGVATTPVLLVITAVTGAIWVGGSLLCP